MSYSEYMIKKPTQTVNDIYHAKLINFKHNQNQEQKYEQKQQVTTINYASVNIYDDIITQPEPMNDNAKEIDLGLTHITELHSHSHADESKYKHRISFNTDLLNNKPITRTNSMNMPAGNNEKLLCKLIISTRDDHEKLVDEDASRHRSNCCVINSGNMASATLNGTTAGDMFLSSSSTSSPGLTNKDSQQSSSNSSSATLVLKNPKNDSKYLQYSLISTQIAKSNTDVVDDRTTFKTDLLVLKSNQNLNQYQLQPVAPKLIKDSTLLTPLSKISPTPFELSPPLVDVVCTCNKSSGSGRAAKSTSTSYLFSKISSIAKQNTLFVQKQDSSTSSVSSSSRKSVSSLCSQPGEPSTYNSSTKIMTSLANKTSKLFSRKNSHSSQRQTLDNLHISPILVPTDYVSKPLNDKKYSNKLSPSSLNKTETRHLIKRKTIKEIKSSSSSSTSSNYASSNLSLGDSLTEIVKSCPENKRFFRKRSQSILDKADKILWFYNQVFI